MGLFTLYLAQSKGHRLIFLSPDPGFDFSYLHHNFGFGDFHLLSASLPAGIAAYLYAACQKDLLRTGGPRSGDQLVKELQQSCLRNLKFLDYPTAIYPPEESAVSFSPGDGTIAGEELEMTAALLVGRLFRLPEIARILGLGGTLGRRSLVRILQVLCLTGSANMAPAVIPIKGSLARCQRCGWEGIPQTRPCRGCNSEVCCVCPDCLIMGGVSLCEPLYTGTVMQCIANPAPQTGSVFRNSFEWLLDTFSLRNRRLFGRRDAVRYRNGIGETVLCYPIVRTCSNESGVDQEIAAGACLLSLPAGSRIPGAIEQPAHSGDFSLEIEFTPPQEAAVAALLKFGEQAASGQACLVWAACGAGKTEVSFPLIGQALGRGEKVLFATPRRDVVLEVAPRLGRAFGSGQVVALYGGSGNQGKRVPLVVATTHQTLRFYQNFDLVILDEGDAFPYPGSRMLHHGVEQACRPGGRVVYLTATPTDWMYERVRRSQIDIIKIPARPHGFPLPEPQFLKIQPLLKIRSGRIVHDRVCSLIAAILEKFGGQLFIFVPTVELTWVVGKALRDAVGSPPLSGLQPEAIEWCHAGDQDRDRKRERFFAGEFPIFVTTTIMERGVTVPRVHVLVLDADRADVFDTPTLVQIAGRCGRSPTCPTGQVWFVAGGVSREMAGARAQIRFFNNEACQAGYLRKDYQLLLREMEKGDSMGRSVCQEGP